MDMIEHKYLKGWKESVSLAIATAILTLAAPVRALEVQIKPETPQLGDTISVIVKTEQPGVAPTVSKEGKNYPTFAVESNPSLYRALLPTTPLDQPGKMTIQVNGDGDSQNVAIWLKNRSFPTQRIRLSGKASQEATQLELDQVAAFKALVTPEKFWNGTFLAPSNARVSAIFGVRRYYNGVFAQDYYHRGVDYAGGTGSPVVAPASGRIALIGREAQGFRIHGNIIGIDHGQGVVSVFLHLSRIDVTPGDFVQAGQTIGAIGSTGATTGPHLHWGLYVHGEAVDPVPWRFSGID
jgi:murein DD-endopeptidase MepM/ murein hydrolase activator NlpD